jgi:hypothetical protein
MSASLTENREASSDPMGIETPEIGMPCVRLKELSLPQKTL